jgi:hypothetical protein
VINDFGTATTADDLIFLSFKVAASDPNSVLDAGDLAAGVMFNVYIDSATAWEADGTVADDIAKATDTTLWWQLGIVDDANEYFYSPAAALDPDGLFGASGSSTVANALFGLALITNNSPYNYNKVNDPSESVFDTDVDIYANVEVVDIVGPTADPTDEWRFQDNDPFVVNVVPEPASLAILGAGLLVVAGVARRRRRRA